MNFVTVPLKLLLFILSSGYGMAPVDHTRVISYIILTKQCWFFFGLLSCTVVVTIWAYTHVSVTACQSPLWSCTPI